MLENYQLQHNVIKPWWNDSFSRKYKLLFPWGKEENLNRKIIMKKGGVRVVNKLAPGTLSPKGISISRAYIVNKFLSLYKNISWCKYKILIKHFTKSRFLLCRLTEDQITDLTWWICSSLDLSTGAVHWTIPSTGELHSCCTAFGTEQLLCVHVNECFVLWGEALNKTVAKPRSFCLFSSSYILSHQNSWRKTTCLSIFMLQKFK